MATAAELYQLVLDETGESDTAAFKAIVYRNFNTCSRLIQPLAGVEKVWSVSIVASTETYSVSTTSMSDFYLAHEGRFLSTGTTDELGNYTFWPVLKQYDFAATLGFWLDQAKTLYARPKPAVAGTLKIYGEKTLGTIVISSPSAGQVTTPEIDAELHEVYAWYACMRYGSRDEDTETAGARYNYFKREYDALINEMDRRYIQREAHRKLNR